MVETRLDKSWKAMQLRLADIRERRELIPQVKGVRKETIILQWQLNQMEHQVLGDQFSVKRDRLKKQREHLLQLQDRYKDLAKREMSILDEALIIIHSKIKQSDSYNPDLIEHRTSVEQAMHHLTDEMLQVLKPLPPKLPG